MRWIIVYIIWGVVSMGFSVVVLVQHLAAVPWYAIDALAGLNLILWGLVIYDDRTYAP